MKKMMKYIYILSIFGLLFSFKVVIAKSNINELSEKNKVLNITSYKVLADTSNDNCDSLLGDPKDNHDPAYYINFAFKVLKYVAILVLLVLSTMDIISAIASSDQDMINKTVKKIAIRAVLCVVIFVLPTFIEMFLQFLNDSKASLCGIRG